MTYDNDGRLRPENELSATHEAPEARSNTSTIIGGVVVLAVILGVIFLLPHRTDTEAVNGRPTSGATTTGSGAMSPNPAATPRPAPPATPAAPATR